MVYLYIVRHGETEWNKEHRLQGKLDSQLTEKGKRYAKFLGEKLKSTNFEQIISSPSIRTLETAEYIRGDRDIPIMKDSRIMEMDMGSWQGKTIQEIKEMHPLEYDCFMSRPTEYVHEGAELFSDIYDRAKSFIHELQEKHDKGNILIVTHGLFIQTLYVIFKKMDLNDFWKEETVDGTSLTVIKLDQDEIEWVLKGDMSHVTEKITHEN